MCQIRSRYIKTSRYTALKRQLDSVTTHDRKRTLSILTTSPRRRCESRSLEWARCRNAHLNFNARTTQENDMPSLQRKSMTFTIKGRVLNYSSRFELFRKVSLRLGFAMLYLLSRIWCTLSQMYTYFTTLNTATMIMAQARCSLFIQN